MAALLTLVSSGFAPTAKSTASATSATSAASADEIGSLPGWPAALPSKQYSGYLTVGSSQKRLHYWLVESEGSPSSDPLVLWLNGGPGCSSLDGFIYEHGPFRTNDTDPTKLVRFPHTWASVANMLYLEVSHSM